MPRFGIVQGRLTPSTELQAFPDDWDKEFHLAKKLGFDYVELIADREFNIKNPFWMENKNLSFRLRAMTEHIICDDYIINHGFEAGRWFNIIDRCVHNRIRLVVLPLLEKAKETRSEDLMVAELYAADKGINIALETTENYYPFNLVYDTGNRVVEGINLAREIKELGSKIVHVHIKDKNDKGENCLLGTGLVNFKEVMQAFKDIGYDGTYTFETVRGKDPIRTAKYNLEFIKFFMAEAS